MQREPTVAAKFKTGSISPLRSLAVPVQFRELLIAKSRKQSFAGDNQLLSVVVGTAANCGQSRILREVQSPVSGRLGTRPLHSAPQEDAQHHAQHTLLF